MVSITSIPRFESEKTRKIERLTKLKNKERNPIIETLLQDESILKAAYKVTLLEMGGFMKKQYKDILDLPIKEQYNKGMAIKIGISTYLINTYPDKFIETVAITKEIEQEQAKIEQIKQEFPFL